MANVDPLSYPPAVYVTIFVVAVVGGLVGYLNKSEIKRSWGQVFTVALTSGFFGFMAFCICIARGFDMTWTIVCVGIVGVMGKRVVIDFQNMVKLRMGLPPTPPTSSDTGDGQ